MSVRALFTTFALLAPLAACASTDAIDESPASEDRALTGDVVYRVTHQNFNKCAYPMCGGFYVKAVNQSKTKCLDGSVKYECYVASADLGALELPEEQASDILNGIRSGTVLVSGEFAKLDGFEGTYAKLVARKAYGGVSGHASWGTFYTVGSSGIVCIKAPCPSLEARTVNYESKKSLTGVDLSALGLDETQEQELVTAVYETRAIVSGTVKTVWTWLGKETLLVATEVFPTVEAKESEKLCLSHEACGKGSHCDFSECLSNCPKGMVCPAVCYGACEPGDIAECPDLSNYCEVACSTGGVKVPEFCSIPECICPPDAPEQQAGSCVASCGGSAPDESCYCDDLCTGYGDCCKDYSEVCQ